MYKVSRSFVAALAYADKLGLAAREGIALVARQSLFGGRYALFKRTGNGTLLPCPEYWISYMFDFLIGKAARGNQMERIVF